MSMTTKLLFYNFFKIWSSARKSAGTYSWYIFKILGWSEKQHGNISGGKLFADSKNLHVMYVC
jgi:hypothetical protein